MQHETENYRIALDKCMLRLQWARTIIAGLYKEQYAMIGPTIKLVKKL